MEPGQSWPQVLPPAADNNRMKKILFLLTLLLVFPTLASAQSDPVGDAASVVDMTYFASKGSGRGITLIYRFRFNTPADRPTMRICADTNQGRVCIAHGRKHVFHKRKRIPAQITSTSQSLRVWIRAAHIGLSDEERLTARANIHYESNACSPTLSCREYADSEPIRYRLPATCEARTGKYLHGPRISKLVALTFDDGPHPATRTILNHLRDYNVPATFYMTGSLAPSRPDLLRRMRAEGHELANHSYNHEAYPGTASLRRTSQRIYGIAGYRPCTFRPPYGAVNRALVNRAGALGMSTIIWDIDTRDWESHNTSSIIRIGSSGGPGSIVLMHDGGGGNYATASAVPQIIRNYRARGYEFVTVDELLRFSPR
jgi:peptidoglycan/xylan/chitin deacetylase (PgdA/CDA1 family)